MRCETKVGRQDSQATDNPWAKPQVVAIQVRAYTLGGKTYSSYGQLGWKAGASNLPGAQSVFLQRLSLLSLKWRP